MWWFIGYLISMCLVAFFIGLFSSYNEFSMEHGLAIVFAPIGLFIYIIRSVIWIANKISKK